VYIYTISGAAAEPMCEVGCSLQEEEEEEEEEEEVEEEMEEEEMEAQYSLRMGRLLHAQRGRHGGRGIVQLL
jgi:hypothetical protein